MTKEIKKADEVEIIMAKLPNPDRRSFGWKAKFRAPILVDLTDGKWKDLITTGESMPKPDFGFALDALKAGKKVARRGWNGKGMFLELQVPDEHSKMTFPYPFFTIPDCEEGTRRIPYASTIVDIMAEDWEIVD